MLLDEMDRHPFLLVDIDRVLNRIFTEGQECRAMRMGADAMLHLSHLGEQAGAILRKAGPTVETSAVYGVCLTGYAHAESGRWIPILPDPDAPRWRIRFEGGDKDGA